MSQVPQGPGRQAGRQTGSFQSSKTPVVEVVMIVEMEEGQFKEVAGV